jgi:lysophospholipase L1-like esterase
VKHRILWVIAAVILAFLLFLLVEVLIIKYSGGDVPVPDIPRAPQTLGSGPPLTYVVMGDSTSIGQGAEYSQSYAVASAQHLAKNHQVTFVNVGVSGAKAKDVLATQLSKAVQYKPDLVLLAVGANDARHLVSGKVIRQSVQQTIDGLKQANCAVRIVVTGSPAMDSTPRFSLWPAKQLMGLRTRQVNTVFAGLIKQNHLTFAPIAAKTRAAFLADPTLFAADEFHPNARGYVLWKPVINDALDQALAAPTPEDCPKT